MLYFAKQTNRDMKNQNTPVGTYFSVGQNVYRVVDTQGNSDLICIAVSDVLAMVIVNRFNYNGTQSVELGSIQDNKLHSNN